MEGKLIKIGENDYILHVNNRPFAYEKLSLKNCKAIENGYDLDELGMDYASTIYDGRTELTRFNGAKVDFTKGFQKALELLGDKKFSEDDIFDSIMLGIAYEDCGINGVNNYSELKELAIKRNTPNEWDVTFNPNEKDADGCLILKRK